MSDGPKIKGEGRGRRKASPLVHAGNHAGPVFRCGLQLDNAEHQINLIPQRKALLIDGLSEIAQGPGPIPELISQKAEQPIVVSEFHLVEPAHIEALKQILGPGVIGILHLFTSRSQISLKARGFRRSHPKLPALLAQLQELILGQRRKHLRLGGVLSRFGPGR